MFDDLKKLGLSSSEVKVYEVLCDLGRARAGKITQMTGLHRTNVYDVLKRLKSKALVRSIKYNNLTYYRITDPKNLGKLIEKQKKDIEETEKNIRDLIQSIRIPENVSGESNINVYQDKVGLEIFYEKLSRIARSKDEVLLIGSSETMLNAFNYYILNLTKKITQINVKGRMIANRRIIKNIIMKRILKLSNLKLRFLPEGYVSPVAVFVFRDNVGFCNFSENPFVIVIEDKKLAGSYTRHFNALWIQARS